MGNSWSTPLSPCPQTRARARRADPQDPQRYGYPTQYHTQYHKPAAMMRCGSGDCNPGLAISRMAIFRFSEDSPFAVKLDGGRVHEADLWVGYSNAGGGVVNVGFTLVFSVETTIGTPVVHCKEKLSFNMGLSVDTFVPGMTYNVSGKIGFYGLCVVVSHISPSCHFLCHRFMLYFSCSCS